jgi:cytochrome c
MKKILLTAVVSSALVFSFACQKEQKPQSSTPSSSTEQKAQINTEVAKESTANVQENKEKSPNEPQEVEEETQTKENTGENSQEETAQKPEVNGQQIFQSKGCAACHNPSADTVGPSLKKISTAYKDKKDELIAFLKGEHKAIVDPAKFPIMQPQLNTTKSLSEEELEALADYILSF